MQIVYLSKRPDILRGTLSSVARYMPFIDEVVLVVPRGTQPRFTYVQEMFPVDIIFDESLIDADDSGLDHQARDYLLRTSLSGHPAISDEFIMSDDDYRPMAPVDLAFFKENDKYRSYYFYDLRDWIFDDTAFDRGQQNTYQILKYLGYAHFSYASHMPQIIRKDLLKESKQRFAPYSGRLSLCEWSTYFNYAHRHHCELFLPPRSYKTLCWPDCITCWPRAIEPEEYVFENYSPALYKDNGPFSHIGSAESGDHDNRFDKILAWYRHELNVLHGRSLDTDTVPRRILNSLLRPLRRIKDVLWLRERTQMIRLANRIEKIETLIESRSGH